MLKVKILAGLLMEASIRNLKKVSARKDPKSPNGYYDMLMDRHRKKKLLKNYNIYLELILFNREVYGYEFDKLTGLLKELATKLTIAIIVAVILA